MRRRDFIMLVVGAAPMLSAWLEAQAQEVGRTYRLGVLASNPRSRANWVGFFGELRKYGFIEGTNLSIVNGFETPVERAEMVATAIVKAQSAFLDFGPEAMRPLVLRDIAEQIGMHESTVSRMTTRKYLHTPRGTFEFKYFFSSGVSTIDGGAASATAIQAMIRKLIDDETPARPMSDQALAVELNRRGIEVARRTVAKYREALHIPSSNERSRFG